MTDLPEWHYNEFSHAGVDYADPAVAASYDAQHQKLRGESDITADQWLDMLGVQPGHRLLDIGCGTGTFTIQAARRCAQVYSADVSPAMLAVARAKAEQAGVTNIVFAHGGFLTYAHQDAPVDVITSTAALHHLPDFWKLIGLRRLAGMLKDGGLFYLMDVVFSFDPDRYAGVFNRDIAWLIERVNAEFAQEAATHFRDEFSTFAWMMEGMLRQAGFRIEQALYPNDTIAKYWCRKEKANA